MKTDAQRDRRAEIALRVKSVSKRFGATLALDDVGLEVARGEIHALLGGNGSGKSTLIKILAGILRADEGELAVDGKETSLRRYSPADARHLGVHVVHQQPAVFPTQSVAENLAIGRGFEGGPLLLDRRATMRRAAEVVDRFDIPADPAAPLGAYSQATQTMIAIARALQDQDEARRGILVLDEPTAALPAHEVRGLLEALRGYAARGQSIVLVTHRLNEVIEVADRATVLRDGREAGTLPREEINHDELVRLIVGRAVASGFEEVSPVRSPGETVRLREWSVGRLRKIDLSLAEGEILGLAGLLGSGRSTLLRSMFGLQHALSGTLAIGIESVAARSPREAMHMGIALVPEDRQLDGVFSQLSVRENLLAGGAGEFWNGATLSARGEAAAAGAAITQFAVKAAGDRAPLGSLSGGNQQKVVLARWLRRKPKLLLLDEPTQGVDIGSRVEIHGLVRDAVAGGAAAIVVSSDFEELAQLADRVVVLANGGLAGELGRSQITPEEITNRVYMETT